jgi:hypothetical protein
MKNKNFLLSFMGGIECLVVPLNTICKITLTKDETCDFFFGFYISKT